jgi:hypothetical protein
MKLRNRIGKFWCALARKLGGRHQYRDAICKRCGAVKRQRKVKVAT